jgi:hypothetical protein
VFDALMASCRLKGAQRVEQRQPVFRHSPHP